MENTLNSSSPESTASGSKSVFKKSENFYQFFEVSLDESVAVQRSEVELETTSGTSKVFPPFKKSRKSLQQPFDVNSNESVTNSETEQSVTLPRVQPVFSNKNRSITDFFNVSYNETVESSQPDTLSKSIDESNIVSRKKNPFNKTHESHNEISVGSETTLRNSVEVSSSSALEKPPMQSVCSDGEEVDSFTFATKQNPFKKSNRPENVSASQLHITVAEENKSTENQTVTPEVHSNMEKSREDEEADSTIMKSKLNPFKRMSGQNRDSMVSMTEERDYNSSKENVLLPDPRHSEKNVSLEQTISKLNNASCLEQSSINDDNLNNWMSDQSDEDMPPPRIPSIPPNLSHTEERQAVSSSQSEEANPLSVWEQKFNEIVSNAERKSKTSRMQMTSVPSEKPKPKPSTKLNPVVEKQTEDLTKYRPPKLNKPASFVTKKLYEYIIKKLEPKYGIDTVLESENLVMLICDTVKMVTRRKNHQKRLIQNLKKEMAEAGLIETTVDFYEFVIKFLPYSFRVKVVPCLQPVTNVVYPPKDVSNPFDKIL